MIFDVTEASLSSIVFKNLLYLNLAPYLFNSVDSAYFARAGPLSDLSPSNVTQDEIEHVLDLVQTRACRCTTISTTSDDDDDREKKKKNHSTSTTTTTTTNADLRVLVPVFDMINHNYEPNAEFFREGNSMVVRAIRDIEKDSEVFIHYGSSTMPVWKW